MFRARLVLLIVLVLACTGTARAATVVVLKPFAGSRELTEALFRLQGELLAVGLEVEVHARPSGFASTSVESGAWFDQLASEQGIDAVIDIVGSPSPLGADVWILASASRSFRAVRVVLEPATPNRAETLAIRAIEVLRANFLVIDLPREARRDEADPRHERPPEAPKAGARAEPDAASRVGVAAGAALLTSTDGVGPALLPLVRVDWALARALALEATLSGLGTRPTVATEAGSVRVAQDYGLVGLRYTTPSATFLAAFLTLSAGALRTTLDGSAEAPQQGHQVKQWAFLTEGSLGARLALSERYSLRLAGHVQWALPYAAIHFVDTEVASTGHPNLAASLAVGASL